MNHSLLITAIAGFICFSSHAFGQTATTEPTADTGAPTAQQDPATDAEAEVQPEEMPMVVLEEAEPEIVVVEEEVAPAEAVVEPVAPARAPALDIQYPAGGELSLVFPTAEESAEALAVDQDERITVDFPDEEVRMIIRNVADLFELNVIIPDTLTGRTSLKLRNVTWQQVFNVVLEPRGFTFIEDGNIIKIRGIAELQAEPTVTRVFLVNYAEASELSASLTSLINAAAGGRIVVDRRSNALVITERPSRMGGIQEIIDRLDRPTAQVAIESKFIESRVDDDRRLGLDWQIDQMQVGDVAFNAATGFGTGAPAFPSPVPGANMTVLSPIQFDVVLRALQDNQRGRLVSNPTVTTLNNTTASINIGDEYPIPEYNYNAETGTFEVSGFEFKPIGINLNVTPQVNAAGFINLRIVPEISNQNGFVNFGGAAGTQIPIIATRKTDTEVTIKDGFTLAIGGLIETEKGNDRSGIPYLMDIPLIGAFFRVDRDTDFRRDLVIFVTAKTLNPDGTDYRETISEQQMFEMGITERDLPGAAYSDAELQGYREVERLRSDERERARLSENERRINELRRELDRLEGRTGASSAPTSDPTIRRPQYR